MKLSEIMTGKVEVIGPDATLEECARKMRDADIGAIPVCDGDKVRGIVTDRDIAVRAVAEGEDPKTSRVSDVMTEKVSWCFEDQDVEDAARLMRDRQVRRIVVIDRKKKLCGIVALGDLAVRGHDEHTEAQVLEGVSSPGHQHAQA